MKNIYQYVSEAIIKKRFDNITSKHVQVRFFSTVLASFVLFVPTNSFSFERDELSSEKGEWFVCTKKDVVTIHCAGKAGEYKRLNDDDLIRQLEQEASQLAKNHAKLSPAALQKLRTNPDAELTDFQKQLVDNAEFFSSFYESVLKQGDGEFVDSFDETLTVASGGQPEVLKSVILTKNSFVGHSQIPLPGQKEDCIDIVCVNAPNCVDSGCTDSPCTADTPFCINIVCADATCVDNVQTDICTDTPDCIDTVCTHSTCTDTPDCIDTVCTHSTCTDTPDCIDTVCTHSTCTDLPDCIDTVCTHSTCTDLPDCIDTVCTDCSHSLGMDAPGAANADAKSGKTTRSGVQRRNLNIIDLKKKD